MSKKTTQETTPGWSAPPPTAATTALQGMVNQGVDYSTPIRNAYARAEQNLKKSYQSPLGAYTTADVRDRALRSQQSDMHQSMGLDLSAAAQDSAQGQFNRQATVAGLTAPQMYNAKQVTTQRDPWGTAMGIGGLATSLGSAGISSSAKR